MARQETVISVFVASASDMADERARLEEIIDEMNVTWSSTFGLRLELLRWETHSHPAMGIDAQDVINRQIPADYDVFIGLLGNKFGTPTGRYGSGTEEEFDRAHKKYLADPNSVEIMLYFRDAPFLPTLENIDDLKKVLEFRGRVSGLGALYSTFDGSETFDRLVRLHLSRKVQLWLEGRSVGTTSNQTAPVTTSPIADAAEDFGLLDALDAAEEHFAGMVESTEQMSGAIRELGQRMNQRTEELAKVPRDSNGNANRQMAKKIVSATALDFQRFSEITDMTLPLYKKAFQSSIDALVKATEIAVDFGSSDDVENQKSVVSNNIEALHDTLQGAKDSASDFRQSIAALPRIASDFNKARRTSLASLDSIISEFEANIRFLREIEF